MKCCKETDLFDRQVNTVNHALTHKCIGYCLKERKSTVIFYPTKHREDDPNRFKANTRQIINIVKYRCRIKFGTAKKHDPTGEDNLTEGILPQAKGKVICDGNQQPKYIVRRNHPRFIQRVSCSLHHMRIAMYILARDS